MQVLGLESLTHLACSDLSSTCRCLGVAMATRAVRHGSMAPKPRASRQPVLALSQVAIRKPLLERALATCSLSSHPEGLPKALASHKTSVSSNLTYVAGFGMAKGHLDLEVTT